MKTDHEENDITLTPEPHVPPDGALARIEPASPCDAPEVLQGGCGERDIVATEPAEPAVTNPIPDNLPDRSIFSFGHLGIPLFGPGKEGDGMNDLNPVQAAWFAEHLNSSLHMMDRRHEIAVVPFNLESKEEQQAWKIMGQSRCLYFVLIVESLDQIAGLSSSAKRNGGFPSNVCVGLVVGDGADLDEKLNALRKIPVHRRMLLVTSSLADVNLRGRLAGIAWVVFAGSRADAPLAAEVEAACGDAKVAFLFHRIDQPGGTSGGSDESAITHAGGEDLPEHPFGAAVSIRRSTLPGVPELREDARKMVARVSLGSKSARGSRPSRTKPKAWEEFVLPGYIADTRVVRLVARPSSSPAEAPAKEPAPDALPPQAPLLGLTVTPAGDAMEPTEAAEQVSKVEALINQANDLTDENFARQIMTCISKANGFFETALRSAASFGIYAWACGTLLNIAKAKFKRGDFGALRDRVLRESALSERTSQRYMKLARDYEDVRMVLEGGPGNKDASMLPKPPARKKRGGEDAGDAKREAFLSSVTGFQKKLRLFSEAKINLSPAEMSQLKLATGRIIELINKILG